MNDYNISDNMKYNLLIARTIKEKLFKIPEFHNKQISLLLDKNRSINSIYECFNDSLHELLYKHIDILSKVMTKEELEFINNPSNLSLLYTVDKGSEVNGFVSYTMYL